MTALQPLRIALAGGGAFGAKHVAALHRIDGVEVAAVVSSSLDSATAFAAEHGVDRAVATLDDVLAMDDVDAVVLATPTPLHAEQTQACLTAGKHVQVEIPLADSLGDAEACLRLQQESGLVGMVGHTRRFNPSHQWVHRRVTAGELALQQMDVQTYFFRRKNLNALGQPRSWTDHLLWHHAAHTVDLFAYQTGSAVVQANAVQGPIHPELGIAMDMSIQLRAASGAICTLSLSFNNDGPLGTFFRYIGDTGTYVARYDDLTTGTDEPIDVSHVDVSMDGIELQDREFVAAIREGREPNASIAQVMPCYRTLAALEAQLASQDEAMTAAGLRRIGPFEVSPIGLGCMNLSHAYGTAPSALEAERLLLAALDAGVTLFDTAALYGFGANEELVGRVLAPHRDRVVLASKCGMTGVDGRRVIDGRPETLLRTADEALARLGTDVIDLYYLHRVDRAVPVEESVGALAGLVEAGKVRAIGLSEVSATTLRRAHAVHPVAALQNEYSLWSRNPELGTLEACRELGIALVAFSPLARGFLTTAPPTRPRWRTATSGARCHASAASTTRPTWPCAASWLPWPARPAAPWPSSLSPGCWRGDRTSCPSRAPARSSTSTRTSPPSTSRSHPRPSRPQAASSEPTRCTARGTPPRRRPRSTPSRSPWRAEP